jgi:hypothetical protein
MIGPLIISAHCDPFFRLVPDPAAMRFEIAARSPKDSTKLILGPHRLMFINKDADYISDSFLRYARPPIGNPLPEYAHLKKRVEKLLRFSDSEHSAKTAGNFFTG